MKNILAVSILIITFGFNVFAQETSSCPTISIEGGGIIHRIEPMIFTANLVGIDLKKVSYRWTVSNGTIMSGQGTSIIQVDTTGLDNADITAAVEIKGLAEGCVNTISKTGSVRMIVHPRLIDEYGRLSFLKEKVNLDATAAELKKDKSTKAIFIIYFTDKDTQQELKKRTFNISKYLTETHKIPKERFEIFLGGIIYNNYRTKIYLHPLLTD